MADGKYHYLSLEERKCIESYLNSCIKLSNNSWVLSNAFCTANTLEN